MEALGAWLLTYLLHSSLLLGGALLLRLAMRERWLGLQEAVLRAALVGGLLTTSLQVGLGLEPLGGVVTLRDRALTIPVADRDGNAVAPRPERPSVHASESDVFFGPLPEVLEVVDRARGATVVGPRGMDVPVPARWRAMLAALWLVAGLGALGRLGGASVRLRRLLRPRCRVGGRLGARAASLASALGLRRPVPVHTAPRLTVPLATGVWHPEVCLPTRALEELEDDQQDAVCAHELAHVARRDPAWILLARGIEAAVPLQPLNRWARRRLQELAECLSDDLAVAASGRPDRLARSLVDVAAWTVADTLPPPAAALGAVSTRSRLGHRVERLMNPKRKPERPGRLLLPLAAVLVLATALVTPVVSGSSAESATTGLLALAGEPEGRGTEPPAPPAPPEPPAPPAAPALPAAPEAPAVPGSPPPPAAPLAPEPPQEPEPVDPSSTETSRRIEELAARIADRARGREDELEEIGARIGEMVEDRLPDEEELAALTERLGVAADAYARLAARDAGSSEETRRKREEARARLAEAREAVQETVRGARIPEAELRQLRDRAREIAERVRPTEEEREEIRRLSEELALKIQPQLEGMHGVMKELRLELEGGALSELREQLRDVRVEIRQQLRVALPEIRELARSARDTMREVDREIEVEVDRAVERERREERGRRSSGSRGQEQERTLEEAEQSHRQTLDEPSGADAPH